jgi:hypothetical protein
LSSELYELVALMARYWFALLAVLILYRGWRASVNDNRSAKMLRDWSARSNCIGELVALDADGESVIARYPVPRECMMGTSRVADIRISAPGMQKRHLWMEQRVNCIALQPISGADVRVPNQPNPPYILRDGEEFMTGGMRFMMVFYGAEEARASAPNPAGARSPYAQYEDIRLNRGTRDKRALPNLIVTEEEGRSAPRLGAKRGFEDDDFYFKPYKPGDDEETDGEKNEH